VSGQFGVVQGGEIDGRGPQAARGNGAMEMSFRMLILALAGLMAVHLTDPAQAEGPVVLTVAGAIAGGASLDFTIADLEKLGVTTITTTTPWYNKSMSFEGVLMSRLMEAVGAKGSMVEGMALNNYYVEIPFSDLKQFDVLLAFKADGEYMSVREKGPLFVIYPFDRFPDIRNELYYSRAIWQLRRLTVK
jgi:hypothetical protein